MAVPDPNAQSPEGNRDSEVEASIDEQVHMLIEKCLQLYMDRKETASMLEIQLGIQRACTRLVWDQLELCNPEFFRNYYTRQMLKQQIIRFNELLEQQCRAMDIPVVPAQRQTSMDPDTAPQPDSPGSEISYENEAESNELHTNPVGFAGSEELAGSNPNSMLSGGDHIANSTERDRPLRIMAWGLCCFDPNPEAPDQQGDDSTLDLGSPSADL